MECRCSKRNPNGPATSNTKHSDNTVAARREWSAAMQWRHSRTWKWCFGISAIQERQRTQKLTRTEQEMGQTMKPVGIDFILKARSIHPNESAEQWEVQTNKNLEAFGRENLRMRMRLRSVGLKKNQNRKLIEKKGRLGAPSKVVMTCLLVLSIV